MSDRPRDVPAKILETTSMPYLKGEAERERAYLEREAKREQRKELVKELEVTVGRMCSAIAPIMFTVGIILIIIAIFYVLIPTVISATVPQVPPTFFVRSATAGILLLLSSAIAWVIGEALE